MPTATSYPYLSAHIPGFDDFVIGEGRVKNIKTGPGTPGFTLLIVEYEPCDDNPEAPTERRFMVHPAALVLEVGEPIVMQIPDESEPPKLLVPR